MKEGTAPTIVLQTFDSPNLSPPALSDGQQSPCSQSKHGCFRPQRKVLSLDVLIETLAVLYKKCFNFYSESTEIEIFQHHLLSSTIKHAGFLRTPSFRILRSSPQVVQYTADSAGRGWESQMFGRRRGVHRCSPFYH